MIHISGHLRNEKKECGFEDTTQPLVVNCCGYQKFITQDYTKKRPQGRLDYQLIYIYKGKGCFHIHGHAQTLTAGSLVVFPPHIPQFYSYQAKNLPEIYWVHFTGTACPALLKQLGIQTGQIGEYASLKLLFDELIQELQLKRPSFNLMAPSVLLKLLIQISRLSFQAPVSTVSALLEELILHLNHSYMDHWDIHAMASYCGLSQDYFSHIFKAKTGCSPMQYLNLLRMEKAKELLSCSSLSISSVASLVGYSDPFYFSRVFKKTVGISPRQFQTRL